MEELTKEQLMDIKGGTNFISATFIAAFTRAGNLLLDLGRSFGTAIRRIVTNNVCDF